VKLEKVESLIGSTREVLDHLLFGGSIDRIRFIAELEPLLDEEMDERDKRELASVRSGLVEASGNHEVLDVSFRMLSVLETIKQRAN
jgi:hypothetical protein